jgi:hypothetical protein
MRGTVRCALAALACVAAGEPLSAQRAEAPAMTTVRLMPLPLERAFALFRVLCMDTFPDAQAVEGAVLAADLGFTPDRAAAPGERLWVSPYGTVNFIEVGVMSDGRPRQECDLRFVMPQRLARRALVKRIGRALAPGRRRVDVGGTATWDLGSNFADRLQYFPASRDIRYFSLNRRHIYTGSHH